MRKYGGDNDAASLKATSGGKPAEQKRSSRGRVFCHICSVRRSGQSSLTPPPSRAPFGGEKEPSESTFNIHNEQARFEGFRSIQLSTNVPPPANEQTSKRLKMTGGARAAPDRWPTRAGHPSVNGSDRCRRTRRSLRNSCAGRGWAGDSGRRSRKP